MSTVRTFLAYLEDKPGVLNRVTSLIRRRGFNIESLAVGRTERPGVSRMTLVVRADDATAQRMEANFDKLVNVIAVEEVGAPAIVREFALVKVRASEAVRPALLQLADAFRARVVDVAPESLVVEITGAPDKVDGLLEMLRSYGIVEMVRTGALAMRRGLDAGTAETATTNGSDEPKASAA